jgi:hypothetical protein
MLNKPALNDWRARIGDKKSEQIKVDAGEFGNAIHTVIEAVCSDGQVPVYSSPKLQTAAENFKRWSDANIQEWVAFEKAAYHDTLRYAGTVDAFARLKNGKLVLVDFKSSKKVVWEYYLQTLAYAMAERYEDDVVKPSDLEGIIIVHLNHDSLTWEAVNVTFPDDELWAVFCALLVAYPHWKKANA